MIKQKLELYGKRRPVPVDRNEDDNKMEQGDVAICVGRKKPVKVMNNCVEKTTKKEESH